LDFMYKICVIGVNRFAKMEKNVHDHHSIHYTRLGNQTDTTTHKHTHTHGFTS
jgi:hypothetical protein